MKKFLAQKIKLVNLDLTFYVTWISLLLMKQKLIKFDLIVNSLIVRTLRSRIDVPPPHPPSPLNFFLKKSQLPPSPPSSRLLILYIFCYENFLFLPKNFKMRRSYFSWNVNSALIFEFCFRICSFPFRMFWKRERMCKHLMKTTL